MRGRHAFIFLLTSFLFASCYSQPSPDPLKTTFYIYRFAPPAFLELSEELEVVGEIPFVVPPGCGLFNVFPAPMGAFVAVELSCPNGQTVLFLDTLTAAATQPVPDSDSHFLAWAQDGKAAYLKVDSLGSPRVMLMTTDGTKKMVPVTEFTYDLAASAQPDEFLFAFSRGMGQGSELWFAKWAGKAVERLYADPQHYISFARYSPDGSQIAFIKIPDTQTPFTVGELWIMNKDGAAARKLADADAGHGYAANWSPDGTSIAFVYRENPHDPQADQASEALQSNIYIVDVQSGTLKQISRLEAGRAETPSWSPDGNTLAFNAVMDDRMIVYIVDLVTGEVHTVTEEPTCCAAWLRK